VPWGVGNLKKRTNARAYISSRNVKDLNEGAVHSFVDELNLAITEFQFWMLSAYYQQCLSHRMMTENMIKSSCHEITDAGSKG
jgi:hypothetical protein